MATQPVWPDVWIKSCLNFFRSCQKISHCSLPLKVMVLNQLPKKSPNVWATFDRKFVAKLPKIAQSGHTGYHPYWTHYSWSTLVEGDKQPDWPNS